MLVDLLCRSGVRADVTRAAVAMRVLSRHRVTSRLVWSHLQRKVEWRNLRICMPVSQVCCAQNHVPKHAAPGPALAAENLNGGYFASSQLVKVLRSCHVGLETATGRPQRTHRLPARVQYIQDVLPERFFTQEAQPAIAQPDPEPVSFLPRRILQLSGRVRLHLGPTFRTQPNVFRLSRFYYGRVTGFDQHGKPDLTAVEARVLMHGEHVETSTASHAPPSADTAPPLRDPTPVAAYSPYPNKSAWMLGSWFHARVQKSQDDFRALLKILCSPDFVPADIVGVAWDRINKELASGDVTGDVLGRGWKRSPVEIRMPTAEKLRKNTRGPRPNPQGMTFVVPNVMHRSITSVMDYVRGKDLASLEFHNVPFKQFWQPHNTTWPKENVISEMFSSPAFVKEYLELQNSTPEPGCTLERVVDGILLGSDSMLLADFGHETLWPVYLMFCNETMYAHAVRSLESCHCVAYIEKVRGLVC